MLKQTTSITKVLRAYTRIFTGIIRRWTTADVHSSVQITPTDITYSRFSTPSLNIDYVPQSTTIFIATDRGAYHYWGDTAAEALAPVLRYSEHTTVFCLRLVLDRLDRDCRQWLPSTRDPGRGNAVFWLCFDRSNGHKGIRRHVWVYNSKAQARNHHKHFPPVVFEPVPATLTPVP